MNTNESADVNVNQTNQANQTGQTDQTDRGYKMNEVWRWTNDRCTKTMICQEFVFNSRDNFSLEEIKALNAKNPIPLSKETKQQIFDVIDATQNPATNIWLINITGRCECQMPRDYLNSFYEELFDKYHDKKIIAISNAADRYGSEYERSELNKIVELIGEPVSFNQNRSIKEGNILARPVDNNVQPSSQAELEMRAFLKHMTSLLNKVNDP